MKRAVVVLLVLVTACSGDDDDAAPPRSTTTTVAPAPLPTTTAVPVDEPVAGLVTHGPFFFVGDDSLTENYETGDFIQPLVRDGRVYPYVDSAGGSLWCAARIDEGAEVVFVDSLVPNAPHYFTAELSFAVEAAVATDDAVWLLGQRRMARVDLAGGRVEIELRDDFRAAASSGVGAVWVWVATAGGTVTAYDSGSGAVVRSVDIGSEVVDVEFFRGGLAAVADGLVVFVDADTLAVTPFAFPAPVVAIATKRAGELLAAVTTAGDVWTLRNGPDSVAEKLASGLPAGITDLAVRSRGFAGTTVAATTASGLVVAPELQ